MGYQLLGVKSEVCTVADGKLSKATNRRPLLLDRITVATWLPTPGLHGIPP